LKTIVLHPLYFGSIANYAHMAQAKHLIFENEDHYQKQTYRNRMHIYGANGILLLNIPIKHTKGGKQHQKYKDVRIENDFSWQKQHWKSFESAYRTSPFFEYYEDEFVGLYEKKQEFLLDFNYQCMTTVFECLQHQFAYTKTLEYQAKIPEPIQDLRTLANAKAAPMQELRRYTQVFESKNGFIPDLSILDLVFNEGPNTLPYLEQQSLV